MWSMGYEPCTLMFSSSRLSGTQDDNRYGTLAGTWWVQQLWMYLLHGKYEFVCYTQSSPMGAQEFASPLASAWFIFMKKEIAKSKFWTAVREDGSTSIVGSGCQVHLKLENCSSQFAFPQLQSAICMKRDSVRPPHEGIHTRKEAREFTPTFANVNISFCFLFPRCTLAFRLKLSNSKSLISF